MKDRRLFLKVKIKSLAAEACIIRAEERKNSRLRNELAEHRRGVVRYEARLTLLAYGFLRGLSYKQIEPKANSKPDMDRIRKMVNRYGAHREYENGATDEAINDFQTRCKDQDVSLAKWIAEALDSLRG